MKSVAKKTATISFPFASKFVRIITDITARWRLLLDLNYYMENHIILNDRLMKSFEMCCRKIEKTSWTDRVRH
jgi:hypothetical protein